MSNLIIIKNIKVDYIEILNYQMKYVELNYIKFT